MARISLIVAMAQNRVIGLDGGIPWHISADLKFFRRVTMGHPIVMGRKTYQSIGGALPGRTNIVITRNEKFHAPDADVVHDLGSGLEKAEAMAEIEGSGEVFIIGGANIYAQAMGRAERIYLTEIDLTPPGDAWFPELDEGGWRETSRHSHEAEEPGGPAYSFVQLERMG